MFAIVTTTQQTRSDTSSRPSRAAGTGALSETLAGTARAAAAAAVRGSQAVAAQAREGADGVRRHRQEVIILACTAVFVLLVLLVSLQAFL